jgi:hypothetical protein
LFRLGSRRRSGSGEVKPPAKLTPAETLEAFTAGANWQTGGIVVAIVAGVAYLLVPLGVAAWAVLFGGLAVSCTLVLIGGHQSLVRLRDLRREAARRQSRSASEGAGSVQAAGALGDDQRGGGLHPQCRG